MLRVLLVDLDETLYPPECGLLPAADRRISEFIARRLSLPFEEADALRRRLWIDYGTTARGLSVEYAIAPEDMCAEALESTDVGAYLRPAPALAAELRSLGLRLVLFTNGTRTYALKVLAALGLEGVFEEILDIHFLAWEGKPSRAAFDRALGYLGLDASEVALVDDNPPNLAVAREMGILAIAVGPDPAAVGDLHLATIHALAPELRRRGLL